MSQTLCCDFVLDTQREPIYWWPLIFEAMAQQSFCFYDRELAAGLGHTSYVRLSDSGDLLEAETVTTSFRAFWEKVYAGTMTLLSVLVWSSSADRFPLEIALSQQHDQPLHLVLTLEGAEVRHLPMVEVTSRLALLLRCSTALYELCQPCTGEIFWQGAGEMYAPWASFGKPLEPAATKRPGYGGPDKQLVVKIVGGERGERRMYVLDPVPIPATQQWAWDFVPLFEEK